MRKPVCLLYVKMIYIHMKAKKKEGLSCLFEIAGQKKGLLV